MSVSPILRRGGFTIISAIFLLVVLSALAAFVVHSASTQQISSAQDTQGARAYHAARAGIEWGIYHVLDPANATVVPPANPAWPNLPDCPATTTLPIEGFSVQVACARFPVGAAPNDKYLESGDARASRIYEITATATLGSVGSPGYAERQLQVRVSKCRATDALPPAYHCP